MQLNCLIIDDEPVARKGMEEYIREIDFLNLVDTCSNAMKASVHLREKQIDLLFLDIQMPKLSGIEFIRSLRNPPLIIFTTAFSEYALEGYSLDVIDYLVKPIPFDRFVKAATKALDFYTMRNHPGKEEPSFFFIKCDGKYERIRFDEVLYVEALQNYIVLYTASRKYITYLTLSVMEEQLPAANFMKIHKSFIIALDKVKSIDGSEMIFVNNGRVPVSRALKDEVMNRILGNNLLKR
ncbi:MAG TPA: LytTR family DNA-binding domain-containing protein [Ohtaekwangia sp.]|uniref:LytR/AlgR family response regulator transcription factor n=1 Tax=Ohtaekwangia sp. TaxID=2066019 RepID=UPI002F9538B6